MKQISTKNFVLDSFFFVVFGCLTSDNSVPESGRVQLKHDITATMKTRLESRVESRVEWQNNVMKIGKEETTSKNIFSNVLGKFSVHEPKTFISWALKKKSRARVSFEVKRQNDDRGVRKIRRVSEIIKAANCENVSIPPSYFHADFLSPADDDDIAVWVSLYTTRQLRRYYKF